MNLNDLFILKVIELVITITCIVLSEISDGITYHGTLLNGTLVAYCIICGVIVIGHLMDEELDKNINLMFSVIGCVLFITAGALIVSEWVNRSSYFTETRDKALATGALMIINGIVFLVDAVLIFGK